MTETMTRTAAVSELPELRATATSPASYACPDCGSAAPVEWRSCIETPDGLLEHAKIRCPNRHWFLMPTSLLEAWRER